MYIYNYIYKYKYISIYIYMVESSRLPPPPRDTYTPPPCGVGWVGGHGNHCFSLCFSCVSQFRFLSAENSLLEFLIMLSQNH